MYSLIDQINKEYDKKYTTNIIKELKTGLYNFNNTEYDRMYLNINTFKNLKYNSMNIKEIEQIFDELKNNNFIFGFIFDSKHTIFFIFQDITDTEKLKNVKIIASQHFIDQLYRIVPNHPFNNTNEFTFNPQIFNLYFKDDDIINFYLNNIKGGSDYILKIIEDLLHYQNESLKLLNRFGDTNIERAKINNKLLNLKTLLSSVNNYKKKQFEENKKRFHANKKLLESNEDVFKENKNKIEYHEKCINFLLCFVFFIYDLEYMYFPINILSLKDTFKTFYNYENKKGILVDLDKNLEPYKNGKNFNKNYGKMLSQELFMI